MINLSHLVEQCATRMKMLRFTRDRNGNFIMIAAVGMIPIIATVGGGLDVVHASNTELQLQQTLDAAALTAAKQQAITQQARHNLARDYLSANLPDGLEAHLSNLTVTDTGTGVLAEASMTVETPFLSTVGINTMTVNAVSRVERTVPGPLEVALVIDTTASMKTVSGGWAEAIRHLGDTVSIILDDLNPANDKYVTVLPFSDRINVGPRRRGWIDGSQPRGWNGCVEPREERIGRFNYAVDDSPPRLEKFSYSIPGVTGGLAVRGRDYPNCAAEITGPSDDIDELRGALNGLSAAGTGRHDVALAWGWRTVSPEWRNFWGIRQYPKNYDDARKVVVLFTDGHTRAYHYEAVPVRSKWRDTRNYVTPAGGRLIEDLCSRMRDEGVEIFVFYIKGVAQSREYFKNCAGSVDRFFEIGGTNQLKEALDVMVGSGNLRLVY